MAEPLDQTTSATSDAQTVSASTASGITAIGARIARASLIVGVLTLLAALFTPAIVAYDDARALEKWEQEEPVEIFGVTIREKREFSPPSEKGVMGGCVMLFISVLTLTGAIALIFAVNAVLRGGPLAQSALGGVSGAGGVILAAWLSPMGLAVLAIIAIALVIVALGFGFLAAGGGGLDC